MSRQSRENSSDLDSPNTPLKLNLLQALFGQRESFALKSLAPFSGSPETEKLGVFLAMHDKPRLAAQAGGVITLAMRACGCPESRECIRSVPIT